MANNKIAEEIFDKEFYFFQTFLNYKTTPPRLKEIIIGCMEQYHEKKAAKVSPSVVPIPNIMDLDETRALLLETARNLGNPAYGQSSATTEAIDELREKALNFLGIPKGK